MLVPLIQYLVRLSHTQAAEAGVCHLQEFQAAEARAVAELEVVHLKTVSLALQTLEAVEVVAARSSLPRAELEALASSLFLPQAVRLRQQGVQKQPSVETTSGRSLRQVHGQ